MHYTSKLRYSLERNSAMRKVQIVPRDTMQWGCTEYLGCMSSYQATRFGPQFRPLLSGVVQRTASKGQATYCQMLSDKVA